MDAESDTSLRRFRIALRTSLWMWALYWPLGGLMLLAAGMTDPVSLIVLAAATGGFLLIIATGGVDASASRSMKEFVVERPMYVIGAAILLVVASSAFDILQDIGLAVFSALFVAASVYLWITMRAHQKEAGVPTMKGPDQVYIALGISIAAASIIFLDALLFFGDTQTASSATSVAVVNLVSLSYPPLILLATRPFREPLSLKRRKATQVPAVEPEPITA